MSKDNCLFCRIVKGEIPSKVVMDTMDILAFEDVNPQAPVHILIVPKRHIEKVSDLKDTDAEMAGKLLLAANQLARENGIQESGYRIIFNCNKDAGQAVFHLHLHLLGGRKFSWPPG